MLGNMENHIKSRGMCKVEVQAVILRSSKSWVVTDTMMMNVLEGFHHRISRRYVEMTARRVNGGEW